MASTTYLEVRIRGGHHVRDQPTSGGRGEHRRNRSPTRSGRAWRRCSAPPVEIEFWDGSTIGRPDGPGRLRVNSLDALRRIIWSPNELGIARAFVAGDIDVAVRCPRCSARCRSTTRAIPRRWPPRCRRSSPARDGSAASGCRLLLRRPKSSSRTAVGTPSDATKQAVSHHYDVGNEFYELVLGPAMTYSCARFTEAGQSLESAQAAKHELICRKLGLDEPVPDRLSTTARRRLLDVGVGGVRWPSMPRRTARRRGRRRDDQR